MSPRLLLPPKRNEGNTGRPERRSTRSLYAISNLEFLVDGFGRLIRCVFDGRFCIADSLLSVAFQLLSGTWDFPGLETTVASLGDSPRS